MKRKLITEEQLRSVMREQGIKDVSEVKEASIERNGQISVIPSDSQQDKGGGTQPLDVS
jgi:uncharacterized membrane protein YcaP (DUF421 family)